MDCANPRFPPEPKRQLESLWVKIDDPTPDTAARIIQKCVANDSKVKPDIVKSIRLLMNRVWVSYQYKTTYKRL
jgi:hypothetical protein